MLTPRFQFNRLVDPVSLLLIVGLFGFFRFYGGRFLALIAILLTLIGLWTVFTRQWEIAIPIETFLVGTWAYNFFVGFTQPLLGVMLVYLLLLAFGFWTLLGRPPLRAFSQLHFLHLTLATLIVWELAVVIQLFWPVEPWSRSFLVVAAMVFFYLSLDLRLKDRDDMRQLLPPAIILLVMMAVVIGTTIIPPS